MTRHMRFVLPAVGVVAVLLVLLVNLNSNLVYFNTPTELMEQSVDRERMRLGGQVEAGTVVDTSDGVRFAVTDGRNTVLVLHRGAPQQLFQEGVGVVVEGSWDGDLFHSDTMIVKHDEQYRSEDGDYQTPGTTDGGS